MIDNNLELIGLVPAAGKGLRLGLPYPKELYPIIRNNHYKPVAQFVLENLLAAGLQHIVFVVNETKSQLMGYFGSGARFNCHISYVIQEPLPGAEQSTSPGLANALDAAYHLTRGKWVCFGMPDTIMQPPTVFEHACQQLQPGDDGALCVFPVDRPEKFGMTRWRDGLVVEIIDKPQVTDLTHAWGCMVWGPRFTEHLHTCQHKLGVNDFAIILNRAIQDGLRLRVVGHPQANYIDLGTYEEIMELDRRLRD